MVCLGYLLSQKGQTTEDFFLARRQIPWWAAMLSFVATEVSAVTIISVPATAYRENWMYAQFFIGSFLARLVLARVFIPAFYEFECTTIYEYLRHRFGPATQYCATVFFFITRLLGSGVRLTAAALALSILLGWPIPVTVFAVIAIGVLYISYGGVRAVVWTGVFQAAIFIVGGLSVIYFIVSHIPGGWHETMKIAYENGKLHLINWGPDWKDPQFFKTFFSDPNIIWIAILNGFFGSMAAFGTDHELMQHTNRPRN
jgi:Na+/proline symporter